MAYTTDPYADLSQLYSLLNASSTVQSDDGGWLQELLVEAQEYIDTELGYKFQTDGTTNSPATRVYDGNEDDSRQPDVLFIGSERILSVTQVLEKTNDITTDIQLQPNNSPEGFWKMRRKSGTPFYAGVANYTVKGVFGRPRIPADISRACARLAAHYAKMRDTNYADQVMEQGLVRLKYTKAVPDDVCQIIDRHKPRVYVTGAFRG